MPPQQRNSIETSWVVGARHEEEVGRLVRAGDDHLVGGGQLRRLGGAPARARSNRRAESHVSSLPIWRLTADCEVCSSRAARVKLPCRAAHSKAISAFVGGSCKGSCFFMTLRHRPYQNRHLYARIIRKGSSLLRARHVMPHGYAAMA